jgi:hypothetical protein
MRVSRSRSWLLAYFLECIVRCLAARLGLQRLISNNEVFDTGAPCIKDIVMYSESNKTGGKIINNTRAEQSLDALNALAVALADNYHHWTKRERWLYGRARNWLTSVACGGDSAA